MKNRWIFVLDQGHRKSLWLKSLFFANELTENPTVRSVSSSGFDICSWIRLSTAYWIDLFVLLGNCERFESNIFSVTFNCCLITRLMALSGSSNEFLWYYWTFVSPFSAIDKRYWENVAFITTTPLETIITRFPTHAVSAIATWVIIVTIYFGRTRVAVKLGLYSI